MLPPRRQHVVGIVHVVAVTEGLMHASDPRRGLLQDMFAAAVAAASPARCLPRYLPRRPPAGRTLVLGAGKAAVAMAAVATRHLAGPVSGLVATRYGHGGDRPVAGIAIIEAGHPIPDAASATAARRMLKLAAALTPRDRLVFLASGGGSATAALPLPGLDLARKQALVRHLLRSGATIAEINCLRRHVSAIKGGRLAAACGTRDIRSLAISDVAGDDPAAIASGPTLPDPTTLEDARAVLERHGAPDMAAVLRVLSDPAAETPKRLPGRTICRIVASGRTALDAAAAHARAAGYDIVDLGDRVEGEAAAEARAQARMALELHAAGRRAAIVSGGELTVSLGQATGRGGPNQEYLAALALALKGAAGISAIACDSDGIDGNGEAAGAVVTPGTLARARLADRDPADCIARHDSQALFAASGDLVMTGPTGTNVNDIRVILIDPDDMSPDRA